MGASTSLDAARFGRRGNRIKVEPGREWVRLVSLDTRPEADRAWWSTTTITADPAAALGGPDQGAVVLARISWELDGAGDEFIAQVPRLATFRATAGRVQIDVKVDAPLHAPPGVVSAPWLVSASSAIGTTPAVARPSWTVRGVNTVSTPVVAGCHEVELFVHPPAPPGAALTMVGDLTGVAPDGTDQVSAGLAYAVTNAARFPLLPNVSSLRGDGRIAGTIVHVVQYLAP